MSRKKLIAWRFKCAAKKLHDRTIARLKDDTTARYKATKRSTPGATDRSTLMPQTFGMLTRVEMHRERKARDAGRR